LARALLFDTTPLIYVIRASLTEALRKLSNPKYLSQSVYEELMVGEAQGKPEAAVIRELVNGNAIAIARPRSPSLVSRLMKIAAEGENKPLHSAEAEALAITKELDGVLIADDRAARSTARLIQVESHGTGYLLGRMFQEGLISKEEAVGKVTEMRKAGWRLSEDDYRTVLNYLRNL
jgi:predicted nucleic acid-binding protein